MVFSFRNNKKFIIVAQNQNLKLLAELSIKKKLKTDRVFLLKTQVSLADLRASVEKKFPKISWNQIKSRTLSAVWKSNWYISHLIISTFEADVSGKLGICYKLVNFSINLHS